MDKFLRNAALHAPDTSRQIVKYLMRPFGISNLNAYPLTEQQVSKKERSDYSSDSSGISGSDSNDDETLSSFLGRIGKKRSRKYLSVKKGSSPADSGLLLRWIRPGGLNSRQAGLQSAPVVNAKAFASARRHGKALATRSIAINSWTANGFGGWSALGMRGEGYGRRLIALHCAAMSSDTRHAYSQQRSARVRTSPSRERCHEPVRIAMHQLDVASSDSARLELCMPAATAAALGHAGSGRRKEDLRIASIDVTAPRSASAPLVATGRRDGFITLSTLLPHCTASPRSNRTHGRAAGPPMCSMQRPGHPLHCLGDGVSEVPPSTVADEVFHRARCFDVHPDAAWQGYSIRQVAWAVGDGCDRPSLLVLPTLGTGVHLVDSTRMRMDSMPVVRGADGGVHWPNVVDPSNMGLGADGRVEQRLIGRFERSFGGSARLAGRPTAAVSFLGGVGSRGGGSSGGSSSRSAWGIRGGGSVRATGGSSGPSLTRIAAGPGALAFGGDTMGNVLLWDARTDCRGGPYAAVATGAGAATDGISWVREPSIIGQASGSLLRVHSGILGRGSSRYMSLGIAGMEKPQHDLMVSSPKPSIYPAAVDVLLPDSSGSATDGCGVVAGRRDGGVAWVDLRSASGRGGGRAVSWRVNVRSEVYEARRAESMACQRDKAAEDRARWRAARRSNAAHGTGDEEEEDEEEDEDEEEEGNDNVWATVGGSTSNMHNVPHASLSIDDRRGVDFTGVLERRSVPAVRVVGLWDGGTAGGSASTSISACTSSLARCVLVLLSDGSLSAVSANPSEWPGHGKGQDVATGGRPVPSEDRCAGMSVLCDGFSSRSISQGFSVSGGVLLHADEWRKGGAVLVPTGVSSHRGRAEGTYAVRIRSWIERTGSSGVGMGMGMGMGMCQRLMGEGTVVGSAVPGTGCAVVGVGMVAVPIYVC